MEWEKFKYELMLRFGSAPYEDGFGELCKLKQTSSVRDYQSHFERLLGKARTLTDLQETVCFLSGLKESIWADVRAQNPTTLSAATSLARIYESKNQEVKRGYIDPVFSHTILQIRGHVWQMGMKRKGAKGRYL